MVTASALHANLIHLSMNMLSQIVIGTYIEFIIGTWKTIILYFASSYNYYFKIKYRRRYIFITNK